MGWFTRKQQQQPAQVLAPKGPGWLSRAWNAYRDYRIERAGAVRNRKELEQFLERDRQADQEGRKPTEAAEAPRPAEPRRHSATVAASVKDAFATFVGGFLPFCILAILTISAGFYFNGLRGFSADVESLVAYGTSFIVEAVNLALFFVSAKAFWSGKRAHFVTALVCGVLLGLVSAIAQVLYLSTHVNLAQVQQTALDLSIVPVLGSLSSTAGIILVRAVALHISEFACCYIIARSSVSHRKIIQQQQEEAEAAQALLTSQQFTSFQAAIHRAAMATMERMIAELDRQPREGPARLVELSAKTEAEGEGVSHGNGRFPGK